MYKIYNITDDIINGLLAALVCHYPNIICHCPPHSVDNQSLIAWAQRSSLQAGVHAPSEVLRPLRVHQASQRTPRR